jgi:phosphosulfolactate synthase
MSRPNFSEALINNVGNHHEGGNFILDKGLPPSIFRAYMDSLHQYVQVVKLGWTTWSLFQDKDLRDKLLTAQKYETPVCLGGTLFEISYRQGMYVDLLKFLKDMDITTIEVASGFAVDVAELPEAIEMAKREGLKVMVEIGYKDQAKDDALTISERVTHIKSAKDSGADYVILEAREIGTGYSVFKADTSSNEALLHAMLEVIPLDKIVFEAPSRANQINLVSTLGPNVNMGNIPFEEIPRVETIRRGLHADTYGKIQQLKEGKK